MLYCILLPLVSVAAKTIIPTSVFDSQDSLEDYFSYNYRWGPTHNGESYMKSDHVKVEDGVLTLTATHTDQTIWEGPKDNAKGYNWIAGTVTSNANFAIPKGGGINISYSLQVPGLVTGEWGALWLNPTSTWNQELDITEFKYGKYRFNTMNRSHKWNTKIMDYPDPGSWHDIICEITDADNNNWSSTLYIDGKQIDEQVCTDCMGEDMYFIIDYQMGGDSGTAPNINETAFSVSKLTISEF